MSVHFTQTITLKMKNVIKFLSSEKPAEAPAPASKFRGFLTSVMFGVKLEIKFFFCASYSAVHNHS